MPRPESRQDRASDARRSRARKGAGAAQGSREFASPSIRDAHPPRPEAGGAGQTVVLCGFHAVTARLERAPKEVFEVRLAEGKSDKRAEKLLALCAGVGVRASRASKEELDGLAGGLRHNGVCAIAQSVEARFAGLGIDELLDALEKEGKKPLLLALDGVTDPHNLGACLRVADAMGCHAVIAPKDKSAPLNPVSRRVSCGASETVPYILVTNLARALRRLKERGVWVAGAQMEAPNSLFDFDCPESVVWVLGSEGEGMRRLTAKECDYLVSIPMFGTVESLNVSVSAGMILCETRRRLEAKSGALAGAPAAKPA